MGDLLKPGLVSCSLRQSAVLASRKERLSGAQKDDELLASKLSLRKLW